MIEKMNKHNFREDLKLFMDKWGLTQSKSTDPRRESYSNGELAVFIEFYDI